MTQDISTIGLLDALAAAVEKALSTSYWYLQEYSSVYKTPAVHKGYMPDRASHDISIDSADGFPNVVITRPFGGIADMSIRRDLLTADIYFGAFDTDDQSVGWRMSDGMACAVKFFLLDNRLMGAWQIQSAVMLEAPQAEPPYWFSVLRTTWLSASVVKQNFKG